MENPSIGQQLAMICAAKHDGMDDDETDYTFVRNLTEQETSVRPYDFSVGYYEPYEQDYSRYPDGKRLLRKLSRSMRRTLPSMMNTKHISRMSSRIIQSSLTTIESMLRTNKTTPKRPSSNYSIIAKANS